MISYTPKPSYKGGFFYARLKKRGHDAASKTNIQAAIRTGKSTYIQDAIRTDESTDIQSTNTQTAIGKDTSTNTQAAIGKDKEINIQRKNNLLCCVFFQRKVFMHLIFFNSKGGVSKSTLSAYLAHNLSNAGVAVSVKITDRQKHVPVINNKNAVVTLYDTAGAYTDKNLDILKRARLASEQGQEVRVIVPTKTGKNDLKEIGNVVTKIREYSLTELIVLTQVRPRVTSTQEVITKLSELGYCVSSWVMPLWEDYAQQRHNKKTKANIGLFQKELNLEVFS